MVKILLGKDIGMNYSQATARFDATGIKPNSKEFWALASPYIKETFSVVPDGSVLIDMHIPHYSISSLSYALSNGVTVTVSHDIYEGKTNCRCDIRFSDVSPIAMAG